MTKFVHVSNIVGGSVSCDLRDGFRLSAQERWYVAITQPRKEFYAAANLANQGFRHFLPLHRVTRRVGRKFRDESRPVFPGYLFVILDRQSRGWRSVNGTFGVRRLLSQGEAPLPVTPGVVETLVQSSAVSGELMYEERLSAGDAVRLIAGPFAGNLGMLKSMDSAGRVRLLLELVGGAVTLSVRREAIQAAR